MVIVGAHEGRNRSADYLYSMRVGANDDLLIGGEDAAHKQGVLCCGYLAVARQTPKIVHALKNNQPPHPGLRECIAVKARQSIRAEAVDQQMVPANPLI